MDIVGPFVAVPNCPACNGPRGRERHPDGKTWYVCHACRTKEEER